MFDGPQAAKTHATLLTYVLYRGKLRSIYVH